MSFKSNFSSVSTTYIEFLFKFCSILGKFFDVHFHKFKFAGTGPLLQIFIC